MEKIPTYFLRDETTRGHPVVNQVRPECQWVADGEGMATVKLDGQNVKVEGMQLYKRQKPADDAAYDRAAYVLCDRADPNDQYLFAAFDNMHTTVDDGIYEAVGPKIQGNPHSYMAPHLVPVVPVSRALALGTVPRDFAGLSTFLSNQRIEGLVFHHPDGRMAKVKRRDFGLPWPIKSEATPRP